MSTKDHVPSDGAIEYTIASTSLGPLLIAATSRGVCRIRFAEESLGSGGEAERSLARDLAGEFPYAPLRRNDPALAAYRTALQRFVEGGSDSLELPLDVCGSRFQRRVWAALQRIPRGATRSYAEVARSIGVPRGARAVASACAANPVALAVPCHRVVPAGSTRGDGRDVGGYRWGTARKRALLEREACEAHDPREADYASCHRQRTA